MQHNQCIGGRRAHCNVSAVTYIFSVRLSYAHQTFPQMLPQHQCPTASRTLLMAHNQDKKQQLNITCVTQIPLL